MLRCTYAEQRSSSTSVMMGVLTHGLVVIQSHPIEQYRRAFPHVQSLKVPLNLKGIKIRKEKVFEGFSYLLYKPVFSNWAMTDPSISPKNLPTFVKRNITLVTYTETTTQSKGLLMV